MGFFGDLRELGRVLFGSRPEDAQSTVAEPRLSESRSSHETRRPSAAEGERVRVSKVDVSTLRIVDLGELETVRTRIKGSMYVVTDAQRATHSGSEYLLIREPKNRVDTKAVAVYGKGRRVGYVSAAKAATLAPLLDSIEGDAFRVTGAGVIEGGSSRLWVDLPKVGALRAFAKETTE